MIDVKSLRIGNWIYPTGRSQYRVVTGILLGMMEKNEDLCKEFEGIELTGELLERIGFKRDDESSSYRLIDNGYSFWYTRMCSLAEKDGKFYWHFNVDEDPFYSWISDELKTLDRLQNFFFVHNSQELPMPEEAKIIPQKEAS